MLTISLFVATLALLVLHEVALLRRGLAAGAAGLGRRALLVAGIAAAMWFGSSARLTERLESALGGESPGADYRATGDPFLLKAVESETPAYPFPRAGSSEEVRAWQSHVTDALRARTGLSVDPPQGIPFEILGTDELGDVRRTFIEFTSWDGTRIPAYVHEPLHGERLPAVLVVPGHGDGIRATAGIGPLDYQHALALELARRGYVTLTAELRGFGLLSGGGPSAHVAVALTALQSGSFYKAVVARDLHRAVSVLAQWNRVDPQRLAVAGASLGGEIAVFLGVLDPRLRVVISHSYGGGVGPASLPETVATGDRQPPHGCHTIPDINRLLHGEDWFRLLAPRAVQVVRGDRNVPNRANEFSVAAPAAHQSVDAAERFEFAVEPGGHEFFVEPAVQFLAKWL